MGISAETDVSYGVPAAVSQHRVGYMDIRAAGFPGRCGMIALLRTRACATAGCLLGTRRGAAARRESGACALRAALAAGVRAAKTREWSVRGDADVAFSDVVARMVVKLLFVRGC